MSLIHQDLIPELQGRFPIRVELKSLNKSDFQSILTEPKNALVKQYTALLQTEEIKADITEDAINEIAALAFQVNESCGRYRRSTPAHHYGKTF